MRPRLTWRLVEWWLSRRVPARTLNDVLSDLEDDYERRRAATNRATTAVWLWREARSVVVAYQGEASMSTGDRAPSAAAATRWLDGVVQDFRHALRALRKSPGFSTTAVLTLGLAIGLCTSLFSIFNVLVLRPWNVRDPGSVVVPFVKPFGTRGFLNAVPLAEFDYFREHTQTLAGLVAWERGATRVYNGSGPEFEHVQLLGVSGGFFEVLGVGMFRGRAIGWSDDVRAAPLRVAVISHELWHRAFGGDSSVVGRTVQVGMDRVPVTIVGVARRGFTGVGPVTRIDLFVPRSMIDLVDYPPGEQDPVRRYVALAARLRPGMSREQAEAELNGLDAQFRSAMRVEGNGLVLAGTRPIGQPGGTVRIFSVFVSFGSALLLVLLLACANIGNLLMARLMARGREILVRVSLGAARVRIVRQLLTEAACLSLAAASIGFCLSWIVPRVALTLAGETEEGAPFTPDGTVLGFAILLSGATTILFALAPALRATRPGTSLVLSTRDDIDRRGRRLRSLLLGAQVALSLTLLTGAGLMTRGLMHVYQADLGFDVQNTSVATVSLPNDGRTRARVEAAWTAIEAALRTSDLAPIGRANHAPPFSSSPFVTSVRRPEESESWNRRALDRPLSAAAFAALRFEFVAGGPHDDRPDARQAVVNETLARMLFAGEQAVGRTVLARPPVSGATFEPYTITGVVRDSYYAGPAEILPLFHAAPWASQRFYLLLRSDRPDAAERLRALLARTSPGLSVTVAPVAAQIDQAIKLRRSAAGIAWAIGALGLSLATIGVFGVFACVVEERRREIGIRLALGARVPHVIRAMFGANRWAVGGGVAVGLVLSVGAGFALRSFLFGLSPLDPWAYLMVTAILLIAAAIATIVPTRRAWRVDPTVTLRAE